MQQQATTPDKAGNVDGHTSGHVFPWWLGYLIDNPLRRRMHPPGRILGPYVRPGMVVLDHGCGFGHFTLGMARLVGDDGRVLAVDVQQKMLDKTMSRARRAGLEHIIVPVLCGPDGPDASIVQGPLDFILAANVLHEVPDAAALLALFHALVRPGGHCYVMEPRGPVGPKAFKAEETAAVEAGFTVTDRHSRWRERCMVLQRPLDGSRP